MDRSPLTSVDSKFPDRERRLLRYDVIFQWFGFLATIVQHGVRGPEDPIQSEVGLGVVLAVLAISCGLALRIYWSRAPKRFFSFWRGPILFSLAWSICCAWAVSVAILAPEEAAVDVGLFARLVMLSEIYILLRAVAALTTIMHNATAGGWNPALVLVLTFLALIVIGTTLLLLPVSRGPAAAIDEPLLDRVRVALFTATSASCVTGLVVVPTGGATPYWSRTGQTIVLLLFQVGGLGIMTWGAFFAIATGRQLQIRESAALRDVMESTGLREVRKLLLTIVAFTIACEIVGAVMLSGLWSHLPAEEQVFQSVFHSVSAFCNAGFSLRENSLIGLGTRWQVWFATATLIITGGIGFGVLYNAALVVRSRITNWKWRRRSSQTGQRQRLTLTSKLVLWTSAILLLLGTVGYYLLEATGRTTPSSTLDQVAEAWFQSVTFRTAGFNTVDHGALQPATKLLAIFLMFIGASPGSTGGGVKTIAFALTALALYSILRGRERVEFFGRTIPASQVRGALAILFLGLLAVMTTTLALVLFENNPHLFLDHFFEATSAFCTVGVSTGITSTLKPSSQLVIIVAMIVGRVGPLTVLLAMRRRISDARYQYPEERVTLG